MSIERVVRFGIRDESPVTVERVVFGIGIRDEVTTAAPAFKVAWVMASINTAVVASGAKTS